MKNTCYQMFIIGMHHTGTSILSNITMSMNVYGGNSSNEFLLKRDNPLKFWERKDIVKLNQERFDDFYTGEMPSWAGYKFNSSQKTKIYDKESAKRIIQHLDFGCDWVTKDPRFGLLLNEWLPLTNNPVCIFVHRNKKDTINSLNKYYNDKEKWSELYDRYYSESKTSCVQRNAPILDIDHEQILTNITNVSNTLYHFLDRIGVQNLKPLTNKYITELPMKVNESYVTLLNNDDENYLRGALALAKSIQKIDKKRDVICLITPEVPEEWVVRYLEPSNIIVKRVNPVEEFWWPTCKYESNSDKKNRWGHMMTKVLLWKMPYKRIMYMDPDSILFKNMDEFDIPNTSLMAQSGKNHPYFNAGVMILNPNLDMYQKLLDRGKKPHPNLYNNVIDCTEQALLNDVFGKVSDLNVMRPEDTQTDNNVALHWITRKCPKPWDIFDAENEFIYNEENSLCNHEVYNIWKNLDSFQSPNTWTGRRLSITHSDSEYETPSFKNLYFNRETTYMLASFFMFGILVSLLVKNKVEDLISVYKNKKNGFEVLTASKHSIPHSAEDEEDDDKLCVEAKQ